MSIIEVIDLPQSIKDAIDADTLALIVAGLNAKAERVAPCLADDPAQGVVDEARLILLGVVKRWAEAGSGAFSQQTAGPFSASMDTRQRTGYNLWPSEVEALQSLCPDSTADRTAFTIDTAPEVTAVEPDTWHSWV